MRARLLFLLLVGLGGLPATWAVPPGYPFARPTLPPAYDPYFGPSVLHLPRGIPESAVPPVGLHRPEDPPVTQPVAQLGGTPIRRALFPSLVSDPVERALIVRDYRRSGFRLLPPELAAEFRRYQKAQFHGLDTARDLRLQREGATLDDYRRYVAEEVQIHAMLYLQCRGASTWAERAALQKSYLARLRRQTVAAPMPT